ncbi:hypothetical protein SeMB42_g00377 [Synchytrium endobioticum]|uniref:Uncharacterized protein n=1 Tax=Synchytrium endobioticum TaxID=286115 RepID=A0A507DTM8_9FUNG|nr:hypothetical protein SeLEV6574_g01283 [Synchytrium endobioticum]TPX54298.1 hypothetical protein SeMB42_g00377 [Synchytrium endobioticum]
MELADEGRSGEPVPPTIIRKRLLPRIRPKILSSLPLQIFLWCSKYLYLTWTGIMISAIVIKSANDSSPSIPNLCMYILFGAFILMEPIRIFMGYTGNLREQIGELAACVVMTGLQTAICVYFVSLQTLIFLGVHSGNVFIQAQNQAFMLTLDEHPLKPDHKRS